MEIKNKEKEVESNADIFFKKLDKGELDKHLGYYALMRKGAIIEFYNTKDDARKTGNVLYKDGIFSIQKVEKNKIDLGYFSHAVF